MKKLLASIVSATIFLLVQPAHASTLQVQQGGTGINAATVYSILTGGTTATGNFQQVSGLGSPGQVLTSNGAASLPTWQPGGSASSLPWSALTNPTGNLSLTMGSDTSTFTYGAATGSANLFKIQDTTGNTGNGSLLFINAMGNSMSGLTVQSNGTQQLSVSSGGVTAGTNLTVNNTATFNSGMSVTNNFSSPNVTNLQASSLLFASTAFTLPPSNGATGYPLVDTDGAGTTGWQVLGTAGGGTGTSATLTQGSVVFAGASGVFSQDNAHLFWDATNHRLGIGTATPDQELIVSADGGTTRFFGTASGGVAYFGSETNSPFHVQTNNTDRMVISAAGNVVVGNGTTPSLFNVGTAGQFQVNSSGQVSAGTWQGSLVAGTYGGTGVNNGASTVTLGGNLTTSGAFGTTLTETGTTSVTLPTSGTLVNTAVATLSSLTSIGTVTSGGLGTGATLGMVTPSLGSDATGDLYYDNAGVLARIPIGSPTNVLTVSGGVPAWAAAGGGSSLTIGSTVVSGATNGNVLFNNSGVLGQYGTTGTVSVVLSTSPTITTPAITTNAVVTEGSLSNANTFGLDLLNPTAAVTGGTAANQQYSPSIELDGQGWKTTATAASEGLAWVIQNTPIQSSTNPNTGLIFTPFVNGTGSTGTAQTPVRFCNVGTAASGVTLDLDGAAGNCSNNGPNNGGSAGFGPVNSGNQFAAYNNSAENELFSANGLTQKSSGFINWVSGALGNSSTGDTGISRGSAGVLDVGTGAQGSTAGTVSASVYNSSAAQTIVGCSTSGNVTYSQPFQGSSYKQAIGYANACLGTASYTFPVAFTNTPVVLSTSGLATATVTSLSSSAATFTGTTSTGPFIIEGY